MSLAVHRLFTLGPLQVWAHQLEQEPKGMACGMIGCDYMLKLMGMS